MLLTLAITRVSLDIGVQLRDLLRLDSSGEVIASNFLRMKIFVGNCARFEMIPRFTCVQQEPFMEPWLMLDTLLLKVQQLPSPARDFCMFLSYHFANTLARILSLRGVNSP